MHFLSSLERAFEQVVEFVKEIIPQGEPVDIKNAIHTTTKFAEFGKAMSNIRPKVALTRRGEINNSTHSSSISGQTTKLKNEFAPTTAKNPGAELSSTTVNPTSATSDKDSSRRLFGLVIGINTYNRRQSPQNAPISRGPQVSSKKKPYIPIFSNLGGAVGDAKRFHKYLTSPEVGIPQDQITLLCEQQATRTNIIKAFQGLADEARIRKGDSIVIYYAGHGAQALPPKRLLNVPGCPEYNELLIPYDFNDGEQEEMGIPDYTLAALLDSIAKKKGDNITIIFDCCHSASALRGGYCSSASPNSQSLIRGGPELNFHIPDELDENIWGGTRSLTVPPRLRHSGAASYVFFSACASFELAKEEKGQGCFTSALLNLLQAIDSNTLRCSQIIQRLDKIPGQNPQCDGLHTERTIFHGFPAPHKKKFIDVRVARTNSCPPSGKMIASIPRRASNVDGRSRLLPEAQLSDITKSTNVSPVMFVMDAGSANGLSKGDEFTVYKSQSEEDQNHPIGYLVIDIINSCRSYLRARGPEFGLSSTFAPALLTKPAQPRLQIYIDPSDAVDYRELISLIDSLDLQGTVVTTTDRKTAHISLSKHKNSAHLCFDVIDAVLVEKNISGCHHLVNSSIGKEDLATIIKELAHYYWHLKRGSPSNSSFLVDISFYELERHVVPPSPRGPINPVVNLNKSGVIDLEVDAYEEEDDEDELGFHKESNQSVYGMELTNRTPWDLYPTLFYFDNAKFTITSSYQPPISKEKSEPPLRQGKSMTIGYGLGATVAPFTFSVSDLDAKTESGFFKLVLSTHPIDLLDMVQDVPVFDKTRGMRQLKDTTKSSVNWASFNILIVQRLRETTAL
ncbi:hypothetical protein BDN70DRAFT_922963 [Pholiota conissans]|uniref:Peptidase C14 caspase domain-containing protein n=1 Tax=Pholiota conissans TaxID=109636 RepID=A0A9P5YWD0_9AGAR|nr:hypothetical protein BDN70DRAFT_922963 [Pholiota conissans]